MKKFVKDWLNRKVDNWKLENKDSSWLKNRLIDEVKATLLDEDNIGYGSQRDRVTGSMKTDARFESESAKNSRIVELAREYLNRNTVVIEKATTVQIPQLELASPVPQEPDIFPDIVGFEDIKDLLKRAMQRKEHILLVGPPGSAKSMFLEDIVKAHADIATYEDGTDSTKEGILDKIFKNKHLRYVCIDELDKMSMKSKRGLLLLMSANKIKETKLIRTRETEVNITVFAAANYNGMIPKELKDRFFVVQVRDYTEAEFKLVARKVCRIELADYIAAKLYSTVGPRVRDLKKIDKLCDSEMEVDQAVEMMRHHEPV